MDLALSYIKGEMVPCAILAAVTFLCVLPIRKRHLNLCGVVSKPMRELALLVFVMYLAGLFAMTLVPYGFWKALWAGSIPPFPEPFSGGLNLRPLQSLDMLLVWVRRGEWSVIFINFPGNIVIFMPIGFFSALLWRKPTFRRALLCGFSSSLFIECFQLLVARGTDVDDLILNSFGAMCGYWAFLFVRKLAPDLTDQLICQRQEVP